MTEQQIITWVIASGACICSIIAVIISIRSDRRARNAERAGANAAERGLWTALIDALQPAVGANVFYTDMHPLLVNIRSAMMEPVDGLDHHNYKHLERWLQAEHRLMTGLFDETSRALAGRTPSVEEMVDAHGKPAAWAAGLVGNVRLARRLDGGQDTDLRFAEIADQAEDNLKVLLPHAG